MMFPFVGYCGSDDEFALVFSEVEYVPLKTVGIDSTYRATLIQPSEGARVHGSTARFVDWDDARITTERKHYDILSPVTPPILSGSFIGTF